ncbi:MAG: MFS transporter [Rhodobiaceae bacterium]|nr:MAG: MFS transporter [Rhodobiaceae bacterium]
MAAETGTEVADGVIVGHGGVTMTKNYRRYALGVLLLGYISSYVDRQIMGVVLPAIKAEFLLADWQLGFLSGIAFAIFYATLGMPIAFFADRSSRRNVIATAIGVWSLMTAACAYVTGFGTLALARIGVGVGEAGSSPPSHSMIADLYPPEERSGALAVYALGVYLGTMIAFAVGAFVVEQYGWREAFLLVGLPGIAIAALVRFTLVEPSRGFSEGKPAPEPKPVDWSEFREQIANGFRHIWNDRVSFHTVMGVTLISFVGYGGAVWGYSFFIRSFNMGITETGIFLALIIGIFGTSGAILGGRLADWLGAKDARWSYWIVSLAKLVAAPLIVVFFLAEKEVALWVYVPVTILGAFYLGPSFAAIQNRAPLEMRTTVSSIMLFIINIVGLGLGPQLVGILSDVLEPTYGIESLRYALLLTSVISLWGAYHYYLAGRAMGEEAKAKAQA